MKKLTLMIAAALMVVGFFERPATALPPFKKAFEEKYVTPANNEDFTKAFHAAGCNVCHVAGKKDKKERNPYGEALSKIIGGNAKTQLDAVKGAEKAKLMKELVKKLEDAFPQVEKEKAADGQTFGDHIKAGKLP